MTSPVFKALEAGASKLSGLHSYLGRGLMQTVGADLVSVKGQESTWNWFSYQVGLGRPRRAGPLFEKGIHGSSFVSGMSTLGGLGMTAFSIAEGYAAGGPLGALAAGFADVTVNAAMVRHGYKYSKNAAGLKVVGPKGGMLGMFARYGMGSMFAIGAREMVGGGVLGVPAAMAGGHLGVRFGGPLALGYVGYQGAKLAGKAGMATLRAGYQHRQMQKQIQTSGSLAAFQTQGAQTMRARAVQSIHKSHLNARSALGHEAQFMHYPSKNYHSRYRMAY